MKYDIFGFSTQAGMIADLIFKFLLLENNEVLLKEKTWQWYMKCFNSRNSDISGTCHYLSSQNRLLDCFSCSTGWSCNFVILTKTTRFLVHLVIDTILFVYTLKTFYNIVWFTYFFFVSGVGFFDCSPVFKWTNFLQHKHNVLFSLPPSLMPMR